MRLTTGNLLYRLVSQCHDLNWSILPNCVAVAEPTALAITPGEDIAVGREGQAVTGPARYGFD